MSDLDRLRTDNVENLWADPRMIERTKREMTDVIYRGVRVYGPGCVLAFEDWRERVRGAGRTV